MVGGIQGFCEEYKFLSLKATIIFTKRMLGALALQVCMLHYQLSHRELVGALLTIIIPPPFDSLQSTEHDWSLKQCTHLPALYVLFP